LWELHTKWEVENGEMKKKSEVSNGYLALLRVSLAHKLLWILEFKKA
jgi:hypothetical protein